MVSPVATFVSCSASALHYIQIRPLHFLTLQVQLFLMLKSHFPVIRSFAALSFLPSAPSAPILSDHDIVIATADWLPTLPSLVDSPIVMSLSILIPPHILDEMLVEGDMSVSSGWLIL